MWNHRGRILSDSEVLRCGGGDLQPFQNLDRSRNLRCSVAEMKVHFSPELEWKHMVDDQP